MSNSTRPSTTTRTGSSDSSSSSSGTNYHRVASNEESVIYQKQQRGKQQDTNLRNKRTRRERLSDKFHALLWVLGAYLTIKYTDFFYTILNDSHIFRPCLILAVIGLSVNLVLMFYLIVYLEKIAKIHYPWEVYCPKIIPTMSAISVATYVLLIRATFPVWGFLSPFILGIVGLGGLFGLSFVPWF